jgi:hypothetical protein
VIACGMVATVHNGAWVVWIAWETGDGDG